MDILVSNGVVTIGNKYNNLDASQPGISQGEVFEVNKVIVNDSIIIPAWSVKFVKIPFKCKLGDWKTFKARPYDNALISNTVFNAKDGFLTLFIINMNQKKVLSKTWKNHWSCHWHIWSGVGRGARVWGGGFRRWRSCFELLSNQRSRDSSQTVWPVLKQY